MSPVNYHAPWHRLRHTVVGATYGEQFYEPIKNNKIKHCLQRIATETEEDYQEIIKVLTQAGVKVQRPVIDKNLTIMNFADQQGQLGYQNTHSFTLIPRPPMQPRDSWLVVGHQLLTTTAESQYFAQVIDSLNLSPGQLLDYQSVNFDAPLATVVGDTIIVDCRQHQSLAQLFQQLYPDYKIKPVYIGGHNDAVFSLLKPGLILSTHHAKNYAETFPNWDVKFIDNQSWNAIPAWRQLKHSNNGKWWSPDQTSNPEFSLFVNQWLDNWLGYVKETVFDVNLLSIDQNTILVNNHNQDLFDFFKKNKIEPIVAPFRHRFFWDGGIHCITGDLYREGYKENYVE